MNTRVVSVIRFRPALSVVEVTSLGMRRAETYPEPAEGSNASLRI
jgi:hypothetical protein